MNSEEGKELRKKAERDRDGKYRSRTHSKAEKRKQRKAWKERKQEVGGENKETTLIADVLQFTDRNNALTSDAINLQRKRTTRVLI